MKNLQDMYQAVLDQLQSLPVPDRAVRIAIEKLEESAFWASCAIAHVESPIAWAHGMNTGAPPDKGGSSS